MGRIDLLSSSEISDGAGYFNDPIVSAGGEGELLHRLLEQVAQFRLERAELFQLSGGHSRIGGDTGALEALALALPGEFHAGPNGRGIFPRLIVAQFGDRERGGLDVQIDAVEQWTADAGAVALDLGGGTAAFVLRVAEVAAGAGIHRGHEHEVTR